MENNSTEIVRDNVKALTVLYFAAQLEELKFFATADQVVEQFMAGLLPLTQHTSQELYEYVRSAPDRLTEAQRRGFYARAFGLAQGSVEEPTPNREFQALWIRFLSAVSQYVHMGADSDGVVSIEQVSEAAKALAEDLSLHGSGIAHFAAAELAESIDLAHNFLSSHEVLKAYGANHFSQLIERVSRQHLGGSASFPQKLAMATAGVNIIHWLADNAQSLSPSSEAGSLYDIAADVEQWLAAAVAGDDEDSEEGPLLSAAPSRAPRGINRIDITDGKIDAGFESQLSAIIASCSRY